MEKSFVFPELKRLRSTKAILKRLQSKAAGLLLLTFMLGSSQLPAQVEECGTAQSASGQGGSGQPLNCNLLLDDLIPAASENTLYVNLAFWVFHPSGTSPGVWGASDLSGATYCVDQINQTWRDFDAPAYNVSAPFVENSKIQFVVKSFDSIHDSQAYDDLYDPYTTNTYYDPEAINIYCGYLGSYEPLGDAPFLPGNIVNLRTGGAHISTFYNTLSHELGHALGLTHPELNFYLPEDGVVN